MAGTRTAPTVNDTPTFVEVQIALMDYTGDKRSDTYLVDAAASAAEIEALVAAIQAVSNATIYRVEVKDIYNSVEDSSNALEEVWENAGDNLVLQAKNTQKQSLRLFVPALINTVMIDGTTDIDPTNGLLTTLIAAYVAVLPTGFSIVGARFTERRQVNAQVKF